MKRIAAVLAILFAAIALRAQTAPEGYQYVDSLVFTRLSDVDSTLAGQNVFSVMPEGVQVNQAANVRNAVEMKARSSSKQMVSGYRIRIFFDNSQTARRESEAALYRFKVKIRKDSVRQVAARDVKDKIGFRIAEIPVRGVGFLLGGRRRFREKKRTYLRSDSRFFKYPRKF